MKISRTDLLALKRYADRAHGDTEADRSLGLETRGGRLIRMACNETRAVQDFFDKLLRESQEADLVFEIRIGMPQD